MNCIAVVTGVCECFPGYEGKVCQRSSCPNTCSGHGRCEYIENLGYAATAFDFADSQSAKFFKTYWGDNTQIEPCSATIMDMLLWRILAA